MKKVSLFLILAALAFTAFSKITHAKDLSKGKKVFTDNCVTCHGEKGDGNGIAGAALNPKPRNFISDPFKKGDCLNNIIETITKGLPGTLMAPYGHLKKEDIKSVAEYVMSLRKNSSCKKK